MLASNPPQYGIPAVQYSAREAAGVSALVGVSCFSLVAVVGLLFLMAVSTLFLFYEVEPYIHHRFPHGPIGPLRTRTSSFELMLLSTSSAS